MRRREFIAALGAVATGPLAAHAQQPAMPVIGFVYLWSADASAGFVAASRKGLGEAGYVEAQNVMSARISIRRPPRNISTAEYLAAFIIVGVLSIDRPSAITRGREVRRLRDLGVLRHAPSPRTQGE